MADDANTPATTEQRDTGNEQNQIAFKSERLGITTGASGRLAVKSVTLISIVAIVCWMLVEIFGSG